MSVSDPIADMATQLRNAASSGKEKVDIKASKMNGSILRLLKEESFIEDYKEMPDNKQGKFRVYLKAGDAKKPAVINIKKISKPGLKVYKGKDEITPVLGGLGISIISTSQGLLTDKQAREKNLGGEVILEVW
jgi:small subunit ribosomal protein S8